MSLPDFLFGTEPILPGRAPLVTARLPVGVSERRHFLIGRRITRKDSGFDDARLECRVVELDASRCYSFFLPGPEKE